MNLLTVSFPVPALAGSRRFLLGLIMLFGLFAAPLARAQGWADNFTLPGANNVVNAIVQTADAIYYGGNFTAFGNVAAKRVVRVDKVTGAITALGDGRLAAVNAMVVIGTDLYVGGDRSGEGGTPNLARWDGSAWHELGTGDGFGVNGAVYALAAHGTDLYVGGLFSMANAGGTGGTPAIPANYVAKWDGSAWSALGSGTGNGVDNEVHALAVSGTDLYVGGLFYEANTGDLSPVAANGIAKWDGSDWSDLDGGVDGAINALAVNGTELYAGGYFTTIGGVAAGGIAKWNGTDWSALDGGVDGSGYVGALAVSGTDLYVGGYFIQAGSGAGIDAFGITKWNGTTWSKLGSGDGNGVGGYVNALSASGSDLYVGGSIGSVNTSGTGATPEVVVNDVAHWNGSVWSAVVTGDAPDALVNAVVDAGDVVYVGGQFSAVGGVAANGVARWNKVTRTWSALGTGAQNGVNDFVFALTVSGTDLYVGGQFTTAGGISALGIAKWNGTAWSSFSNENGNGINVGSVQAIAVSGTDVYVGGSIASTTDVLVHNIAKWNGTTWSALGTGTSSSVSDLAVIGTDLYAGGTFVTAGGVTVNKIAKWDGSAWSALGTGIGGNVTPTVNALAVSGTDLYAAGRFSLAGGGSVNNIAKWDGSAWSTLAAGLGTTTTLINGIAVSGTNLYACASTSVGLQRWNGSAWSILGTLTGSGFALAANGSDVFVGGSFTTAGGKQSLRFAEFGLPVVRLEQPVDTALLAGATHSLGTVAKDASGSQTFTLRNIGPIAMTSLGLTITGTDAARFAITASPSEPVAPAGTTTFTVQFTPIADGLRTATLHLTSSDTDHSPFDLVLTATGSGYNLPPVAGADTVTRPSNSATLKLLRSALLANDSDADSDTLSLVGVGAALPSGATVSLSGNFVLYTVPTAAAGNGSFTYTLSDGSGGHTVTGTVTVTEAPLVIGDSPANAKRVVLDGGHFAMTFIGVPGRAYRVQYTTALGGATAWQEFAAPALHTAPDSGVFTHTDTDPPVGNRFYRAIPNP